MNEPYETIDKENVVIKIYPDSDLMESPREWDNLGTMVCSHSRYNLGDEQIVNGYVSDESWDNFIVLPLYLYDHSGISMSTGRNYPFNCPWDSGQVGYIYVSRDKVRKEYEWKYITKKRENQIKEYLNNEVKTYDQYLTGDVYGYNVECEKCEEVLDSCWGFYGSEWKENGLLDHADTTQVCPNCDISGLLN